jgi:hypothetical protein
VLLLGISGGAPSNTTGSSDSVVNGSTRGVLGCRWPRLVAAAVVTTAERNGEGLDGVLGDFRGLKGLLTPSLYQELRFRGGVVGVLNLLVLPSLRLCVCKNLRLDSGVFGRAFDTLTGVEGASGFAGSKRYIRVSSSNSQLGRSCSDP